MIKSLRKLVAASALAACALAPSIHAQTITVNGTACPAATVTFGGGTIAINTAGCGGGGPIQSAPQITNGNPPAGNVGVAYSFNFTASGSPASSWSVSSGTLPAGLTLAANGVLSGTPTAPGGSSMFGVTAANGVTPAATANYTVNIANNPAITSALPLGATVGVAYSHTFTASQAVNAGGWSISPAEPAGLTLNANTGLLSGTPTAAATTTHTITAATAGGNATQVINFVVASASPVITSGAPPAGTQGTAYMHNLTATGVTPITWSVAAGGTLPTGLSIVGSAITGTPTAAGTFTFAVTATNGSGSQTSTNYSVTINPTVPAGALTSIEGHVIPNPSKQPSANGPLHAGLNGAGANMNAWAVDATRCTSPTGGPTSPAITRYWHHNIDFDNYVPQSSNDKFDMAPNEALSYRFVPTLQGVGNITISETTDGPLVETFMSLSTKPCDFDYTKLASGASRDFCYKSATREYNLNFHVTNGTPTFITYCKLVPGTTYYLNIRHQDGRIPSSGGPATDSCATNGSGRCAGLIQIVR